MFLVSNSLLFVFFILIGMARIGANNTGVTNTTLDFYIFGGVLRPFHYKLQAIENHTWDLDDVHVWYIKSYKIVTASNIQR